MIALIAHYAVGLAFSLVVGLVTAWWVWGYRPAVTTDRLYEEEAIEWPPRAPDAMAENREAPPPWAYAVADGRDGPAAMVGEEEPPVAPPPATHVAAEGGVDDLTMIKGVGPQIEALLRSLGVNRFTQIANWMPEDIERVDANLGEFKGRIIRDEWIAQARLLAAGDMETFNQRYGRL